MRRKHIRTIISIAATLLLTIAFSTSVLADAFVSVDTIYPGKRYTLSEEQLRSITAMCLAENGERGLTAEASQMANLYEHGNGGTPLEKTVREKGENILLVSDTKAPGELSGYPETDCLIYPAKATMAEQVNWSPEKVIRNRIDQAAIPKIVILRFKDKRFFDPAEEAARLLERLDGPIEVFTDVVQPKQGTELEVVQNPHMHYYTDDQDLSAQLNEHLLETEMAEPVSGDGFYNYIEYGGWYATSAYYGHRGSYWEYYNGMRQEWMDIVYNVITNGNRVLPEYVTTHDSMSDITWKSTADWIPNETVYSNCYGGTHIFYGFPNGVSDPFGYDP